MVSAIKSILKFGNGSKRSVTKHYHTLARASENMVQMADPVQLSRAIAKTIQSNFQVDRVGILLKEPEKNWFTFRASQGEGKIPDGLIKMTGSEAFVRWFSHDGVHRRLAAARILTFSEIRSLLNDNLDIKKDPEGLRVILNLYKEMQRFHASVVAPSFYKDRLLAILLLGTKNSHSAYTAEDLSLLLTLSNDVAMTVHNAHLFTQLKKRNQMLQESIEKIADMRHKEHENMRQTVRCLAGAIAAKDAYTGGHLNKVTKIGMLLGEMVFKEKGIHLDERQREMLLTTLQLHDLGKVGTPDAILKKQGGLTPEEMKIMREHANVGARILAPLTYFKEAAHAIQHHHEKWDGSGYPDGLKGEEIPLASRIVSIADAYHAMVSNRPYHKGMGLEQAIERLRASAGKHFDPLITSIFLKMLQEKTDQVEAA